MNPTINILTRTSNRPIGFSKCKNSIKNQTYKKINHIVSYDNDEDLKYLNNCSKKIKINRNNIAVKEWLKNPLAYCLNDNPRFWYHPSNLYCNYLLKEVKEGWIMFLDDDDMLYNDSVIQNVVNNIVDEDTLLIWKMRYPTGRCLPDEKSFEQKQIRIGGIGSPCFLFNQKYIKYSQWDEYKCSDFRFLEKLYNVIPNKKWINEVFIQLNNEGGYAKREDIN